MVTLILAYFRCDDQGHNKFCTVLDLMLNSINRNTQVIIGGDINAWIGKRTCNEHKQVLGSYGIPQSNARGKNLIHVLAAHNLQIENTIFNHQEEDYIMYTNIPTPYHPNGVPSMQDIFACSQSFHKCIHNCKMVLHGVASNCMPKGCSLIYKV